MKYRLLKLNAREISSPDLKARLKQEIKIFEIIPQNIVEDFPQI